MASTFRYIPVNIGRPALYDHSSKHGCFPIEIQYLRTVLGRILFSSVINQEAPVQILSRSYISAMHLLICFFVTDFVGKKTYKGISEINDAEMLRYFI